MSKSRRRRFETSGWVVFVASAIFYTWAGLRAGDVISTLGSVLFLLACFLFLAPMMTRKREISAIPKDNQT